MGRRHHAELLEAAGKPDLLDLGCSPSVVAEAFWAMAGIRGFKVDVSGGIDRLLDTPLNTSFSLRNTLGVRTNSVDMYTVIETMILDVEEENGV